MSELDDLLKILPTSDSPLPDRQQVKDWVPEVARAADAVRESLMAGRAVQDDESPPTELLFIDADGREMLRGRASESPPTPHTQDCIDAFYSDGGQSGCICGADR